MTPLRQRAMLDGICGLAGTAIPQEAEPSWNVLPLPFWDNHNKTKQKKKNARYKNTTAPTWQADGDRKCPTEAETGGETPGKTQAKEACCFCLAQLRSFSSLVMWIWKSNVNPEMLPTSVLFYLNLFWILFPTQVLYWSGSEAFVSWCLLFRKPKNWLNPHMSTWANLGPDTRVKGRVIFWILMGQNDDAVIDTVASG